MTEEPKYPGDGAAIGKWYCPWKGARLFHLIKTLNGRTDARAMCGTRFGASFDFDGPLGKYGQKCPKCLVKEASK